MLRPPPDARPARRTPSSLSVKETNGMTKIKCDNIDYRKGYIEVSPKVHKNCINIETREVNTEIDLSKIDISDDKFSDDWIISNTELELSAENALELIAQLSQALDVAKKEK